jgi:hypothetical protein
MASTYYAWTNFTVVDENGKRTGTVQPGDTVTAADLGVSDEDFQAYVDSGAIRTVPYPDMGNFPGSPVELAKAQLEAASSGGFFDTQYGRVTADTPPAVNPETGTAVVGTDQPTPTVTNAQGELVDANKTTQAKTTPSK